MIGSVSNIDISSKLIIVGCLFAVVMDMALVGTSTEQKECC